jgi:predicted RNA binding protein YcfA (HicA-like mRNA interferase family)
MNREKLEKHLREHGCVIDHQGSDHAIWRNPANESQTVVPRHSEINTFTARGICKQLGIPKPAGR